MILNFVKHISQVLHKFPLVLEKDSKDVDDLVAELSSGVSVRFGAKFRLAWMQLIVEDPGCELAMHRDREVIAGECVFCVN